MLAALTSHDVDKLARALLELSVVKRQVDREQFRTDLVGFVGLYKGRRLGEVKVAGLASHLLALLRKHHLQLPQEIAVLLKFFLMMEGMGVRLDPEFNLGAFLGPYARQLARERFSPEALARQLLTPVSDAAALAANCPSAFAGFSIYWTRPALSYTSRASEFEPLVGRAERIGDRLVAGSSQPLSSGGSPSWRRLTRNGLVDGKAADGDRPRHVGRLGRLSRLDGSSAETSSATLTFTSAQGPRRRAIPAFRAWTQQSPGA